MMNTKNIIDAHCHIYPEKIALKAVESVERFYPELPRDSHDGTARTLIESGAKAGIDRFLVHSVATNPLQVGSINRFISGCVAASEGRFIGFGTLHPLSPRLREDFEDLIGLELRGVKLHPDIQEFAADIPEAMLIYSWCEERNMPVLVHTGDYRYDYSNPDRIANILRTFPGLSFIGAHFAGWSVWDQSAKQLSDFPNLTVDTSSSLYFLGREKAKQLIDVWTPDRMMFGTDYPLWQQQPEIDFLMSLGLSEDDYDKIFRKTAERVIGFTPVQA
ncbi:MAG: amidohydrolase family protein [Clostridia bacterium]|nr:amidohydrolase family protein [Clostridia bacterium]